MRDFTRLDAFLDARLGDIYPEPMGEPHLSIIAQMVPTLIEQYRIKKGSSVLDVGCGYGEALRTFRQHGMVASGVGFGEEAAKARAEGFEIFEQDMSFLDITDGAFDVVWCRHVMEHSLFPYFTLSEMFRILKPGGVFYMEVPAPDTACQHETNANHYSIHTRTTWFQLLSRCGFVGLRSNDISFTVPAGPDTYYVFDGIKPGTA